MTLSRNIVLAALAVILPNSALAQRRPQLVHELLLANDSWVHVYRIAVDRCGYVWACGATGGTFPGEVSQGDADAVLIRFHRDRPSERQVFQWGTRGPDRARGLCLDRQGNCYVVGRIGDFNDWSGFVRKYDARGCFCFERRFSVAQSTDPDDCVIDRCGRLNIVGSASRRRWVGFVQRYSLSGRNLGPAAELGADGESPGHSYGIAADPVGGVIVAGQVWGRLNGQPAIDTGDSFIARLNARGQWSWISLSQQEGRDANYAVSVIDGQIYTSGWVNHLSRNTTQQPGEVEPEAAGYEAYERWGFDLDGVPVSDKPSQVVETNARQTIHQLMTWRLSDGALLEIVPHDRYGGGASITPLDSPYVLIGGSFTGAKVDRTTGATIWNDPLAWSTLGTAADTVGNYYVVGARPRTLPNGDRTADGLIHIVRD